MSWAWSTSSTTVAMSPRSVQLVRAFLKVLRTTSSYRLAAIRLSRIVFQYFPKEERPNARPPSDRLLAMLRGAPAFAHAAQFIRRAAALQASLREEGGQCLFDTDVSRREADAFVAEVRARLASRTPFSFIRIDDGEGNAVPYGAELAQFADVDAAERERVWWGRPLDAPHRAALNARVLGAMQAADALGIPAFSRILRDIRLDGPESFAQSRTGRGITAVLNALEPDGAAARRARDRADADLGLCAARSGEMGAVWKAVRWRGRGDRGLLSSRLAAGHAEPLRRDASRTIFSFRRAMPRSRHLD